MGYFFKYSMVSYSVVLGRIRPKFELVLDFMVVLLTCKTKEDSNKHESPKRANKISPIMTLLELSVAMETRVPNRSGLLPIPMVLQIKFDFDLTTGLRDIHV